MEGEPIVHIHPTSRWLFKCWKDEYMAEVILWLLSKGMAVVLTSSPERREMEKAERILFLVGTHQKLINLCGNTTIKQLGAVAQLSTLFFGVDSAPMHIAAAVGTPVIALFGPSGPHSWRPWNNSGEEREPRSAQELLPEHVRGVRTYGQHTTIQRGWDCVPCGRDGCNGSKVSRCLEDIRVDEVRAVIEEKLKGIGK